MDAMNARERHETMLTLLRHMAYGSDEAPTKDVGDTDLYQALIPYVRLSIISFASSVFHTPDCRSVVGGLL
jgi:hypothetical protein